MAEGYTTTDGTSGGSTTNPDSFRRQTQVWFSGTSGTAGQVLMLDTAATLPTGVSQAFKVCTGADDSPLGGLILAETFTGGPSTGTLVKVWVEGTGFNYATHGLAAVGAISVGATVGVSTTTGLIKSSATAGVCAIGICTTAYTNVAGVYRDGTITLFAPRFPV